MTDEAPARMDPLAPLAHVTRRLPRAVATKVGWHVGERASRRNRVARLRNGGRVVVDIGDYQHRRMYFLGEYEVPVTRLFQRLATPGWAVLDVGANVGYFSVVAAVSGGGSGRVVAFEPNPRLARMLRRTISLNPLLAIRVEQAAVGERVGSLPLRLTSVSRNSGLSSLRSDLPDTSGDAVIVSVVTVDDYCAANGLAPDLIKIDVEGFELHVLRGASRTLMEAQPRAVICEVAPDRVDPREIIDLMASHGYGAYGIDAHGALRTPVLPQGANWEDLCFVRTS